MAIVISRTGELNPQYQPFTPEQREAAWGHILKVWMDKNEDSLRTLLEADAPKESAPCL